MVSSWSDLLWPLIVNSSPDRLPVSVGLASLIGQYITPYQLVMAGAVIASAPVIVVFLFGQRNFVKGLAAGALK
jgi:multiple sugar transport system permease protein